LRRIDWSWRGGCSLKSRLLVMPASSFSICATVMPLA
jgi:hypothetical protein